MADGEAQLDRIGPGSGPSDIARGQPRIDETMEEALVGGIATVQLNLEARQETPVLRQAESASHM